MSNALLLVLVVVALAGAEAVYYFVRYLAEKKEDALKRRLRRIGDVSGGPGILRQRRLAVTPWLNELLSGVSLLMRLERLLEQTDLELSVAELCAASAAAAGAGLGLGLFLRQIPLAIALGLIGGTLPLFFVLRARRVRGEQISEQLPSALDMMARAIKAGHALPTSLKLIAEECPRPVAIEFARAFEQQNLGVPFERAILAMTERVPKSLDLRLFAVSVVIQKESGGNLVEVLENISTTVRERFKFYGKLRALTAEGRISGIILGVLPFGVAALIMLTNPGYLAELGEGLGLKILIGGITSWCFGVMWIRSLMKVDF